MNSLCNEPSDNLLPPHSQQLANDFGEFFCRKIELIKEDIGQESVCELRTYDISCPSAKLERFSLVSDEEILSIIMSASSASCQLDPIPTWLVKQCAKELAPIFAKMINSSLTSGVIPENWKLALVIPLLKKLGLIFSSFRPVSNLPFISKTAEKVVIPQVLDHCEANAPLPSNQSSYRQHHSTETALLRGCLCKNHPLNFASKIILPETLLTERLYQV